MGETKKYLEALFNQHKISTTNKQALFNEFISNEENVVCVKIIQENQKRMLDKWKLKNRVDDIIQHSLLLPNGTVNKQYSFKLDFLKLGWNDIIYYELIGLDDK